ncbi:MAG: TIGR03915 family putative DNA repair protein [Eubacteriales bacterium]|nr:TIGR03915 family putative DNA repair protein [Eubacteriales bacterium]
MTVFTCEDTFEGMMTCIYDAWAARLGHKNVRLQTEPVLQQELFCQYVHVSGDTRKTEKVVRSVQRKISVQAYRRMYLAAMSFETDKLDAIYRFLVLGFAYGPDILERMSEPAVMRIWELSRKVGNEAHFFREFTRFTSLDGRVYVAHIEPKCNITAISAEHFADRMPSENWMIIDDNRRIGAVHPKNQPFYMTEFSKEEMDRLLESEEQTDEYTDLWKEFFRSIGIEARKNPKCQRNMMPLWYRKHATEFR